MADDSETIRLRGREKASLTRIANFVETLDGEVIEDDLEELKVRLEKLDDIWTSFNEHDSALPEESSGLAEFETKFFETKAALRKLINSYHPHTTDSVTDMSLRQNQLESQILNISQRSIADIKMPRLNIPIFTGDFLEWPSFKDLFCAVVHDNTNITKIQKFQYLKGLLAETPATLIRHLPMAESSYDAAWNKILERYDKKKKIVTSLITTFLSQPKITNATESALRKLADTSDVVIRGLKSLHEKADSRDPWLIHLLLEKVDQETRQIWAEKKANEDFPTIDSFIEFLNNRSYALEISIPRNKEEKVFNKPRTQRDSSNLNTKCLFCKGNHYLFKCVKFKDLDVVARKNFVQRKGLCFNCLSDKHSVRNCPSTFVCQSCKERHNTLLHQTTFTHNLSTPVSNESEMQNSVSNHSVAAPALSLHSAQVGKGQGQGLLPTASVFVRDSSQKNQVARIMFDSGSEQTFISEEFVKRLGLKRRNARLSVIGLADSKAGITKGPVSLLVSSKYDANLKVSMEAYVLNKLTAPLPSAAVDVQNLPHLLNIQLADPAFMTPGNIDLIIGADYFLSIILPGQIVNQSTTLIAQNSKFGWIISGKSSVANTPALSTVCYAISGQNVDQELKRFWEIENIPIDKINPLNEEEDFCENHFKENYTVNANGRFAVRLPFYRSDLKLGNSYSTAQSRLKGMERKFALNSDLELHYKDFMREYEGLNHLQIAEPSTYISDENKYFLAHHCVLKPTSSTSALRVVFDASCKTSNSVSLNSILGVGAKQQPDLFITLLRFRLHEIAFTADIEKMYRQIEVHPEDQNYQRILWRYDSKSPIHEYKLKTVTYGLSSSAFLATRCLKQVSMDAYSTSPVAAQLIEERFYMDDLLAGASNVHEAVTVCTELSSILESRGFHLRKWKSNKEEFLTKLGQESHLEDFQWPRGEDKVLGILWNSNTDSFRFEGLLEVNPPLTKRKILSCASKIFDPLGILTASTILIKIFFQRLWMAKGDWDSEIPEKLAKSWREFQDNFKCISEVKVPRFVANLIDPLNLVGFCDASELAYSAIIYCQQKRNNEVKVEMLVAKARVAPIKQISIPKLELCGAHLLTKLFKVVLKSLKHPNVKLFAYTDSKVVLSWLSSHPRKWKTFVANRTADILETLPNLEWNHVPSRLNPADIASRGLQPNKLSQCDLWLRGPKFLHSTENLPKDSFVEDQTSNVLKEKRKDPLFNFHISSTNDTFENLFERFSSITKIIRIIAYCKRFLNNCKITKANDLKTICHFQPLLSSEIERVKTSVLTWVQNLHFGQEIDCVKKGLDLPRRSKLVSLTPFLDSEGLLRVKGRIVRSDLNYSAKHPVIIPSEHSMASLLIKDFHIKHLHAGPTLLSNILRQIYWIIGGKKLIRRCVNKCLVCFRYRSSSKPQMMGDLPEPRVKMGRPFINSGVDYAGPITIKTKGRGRSVKTSKAYIALFICFSTKALHLEVVSDLTADAFIAALRRFSARRGAPANIYCDNSTTFIGARNKLNELKELHSLINCESVAHFFNEHNISFHMIPPYSPHFGGLWEGGVKATKYHLKRLMGTTLLTFEELTTLVTQIEAVLNSRPLSPVSEGDIDSIHVLTPSHFLVGELITSLPDQSDVVTSHLTRWNLLQNLFKSFWNRWHKEYLNTLQQRSRWRGREENLSIGDIVLLKETNLPPGIWPLAKVIKVFPGDDGVVRVVQLKTLKGLFKRNITNCIKLSNF